MLQALPDVLTSGQRQMLVEIVREPLPPLPQIGDDAFAEVMKVLSTLKRKRMDDDSAELYYRVYAAGIRHLPAKQIWWAVNKAIQTLTFFPTVAEFIQIAEQWRREDDPVLAQREARRLLNRERLRINSARKAAPPLTQDMVDAMTEEHRRLGITTGALIERDGKIIPNPEPMDTTHEQG